MVFASADSSGTNLRIQTAHSARAFTLRIHPAHSPWIRLINLQPRELEDYPQRLRFDIAP
jgi:hypothetical protein